MALAGALAGILFGNVGALAKAEERPLREGISSAGGLAAKGTVESAEAGPSQVSTSALALGTLTRMGVSRAGA